MTSPDDLSAAARLTRLADGYLATQLLYAAVALGVPDALADGPRSAGDLADAVGAVPGLMYRVLRGLAAEEVVEEGPDGRFALTAMGAHLTTAAPVSLRGMVGARGDVYYGATAGLVSALRGGGTPYEIVHGRPFFAHLAADPPRLAAFQSSMADRSAREAGAVVEAYDVARFASIVDVGGGGGVLLRAVREHAPHADLVLFDRPEVVAAVAEPGLRTTAGDFFAAVPPGADLYLMSRVLHDWDDADAVAVLRTCRVAMRPDSVLAVVEAVLPEHAADDPAAVRMDLHMLVLLNGRERTVAEYATLFDAAGLRLTADVPTSAGVHVLEATTPPEPGRTPEAGLAPGS